MKQKQSIIVAAIAVVLIAVTWRVVHTTKKENERQEAASSTASTLAQNSTTTQNTVPLKSSTPKIPPAASLSYAQALNIYGKSGYRIQFSNCSGNPGSLSIAKGTKFMLDNRDDKPHKIVVKSQTFNLKAYGFAVVTAKDVGTYNITCDGGGSAELNVES
jgi:hypothetical protein